jgi:hypothetical protein
MGPTEEQLPSYSMRSSVPLVISSCPKTTLLFACYLVLPSHGIITATSTICLLLAPVTWAIRLFPGNKASIQCFPRPYSCSDGGWKYCGKRKCKAAFKMRGSVPGLSTRLAVIGQQGSHYALHAGTATLPPHFVCP